MNKIKLLFHIIGVKYRVHNISHEHICKILDNQKSKTELICFGVFIMSIIFYFLSPYTLLYHIMLPLFVSLVLYLMDYISNFTHYVLYYKLHICFIK